MVENGGLNVKVNVDVSEAISGLKALQREAKRATADLRELEAVTNGVFRKNEVITWEGAEHNVITADVEYAVLAPIIGHADEAGYVKSTDLTRLFAVSNDPALYSAIADRVGKVAARE
jgi:hypothetical protein